MTTPPIETEAGIHNQTIKMRTTATTTPAMWSWDPCDNQRMSLFSPRSDLALSCTSTASSGGGDTAQTELPSTVQPGLVEPVPTRIDLGGGTGGAGSLRLRGTEGRLSLLVMSLTGWWFMGWLAGYV